MTLDDYLGVADDHHAVLPVRLRRARRRLDRGGRVARAEHGRPASTTRSRVEAVGTALRGRPSWDQFDDLTTMALRDAAGHDVGRAPTSRPPTSTSPSSTTGSASSRWCWLEALGFCGQGEGGPFIEGGKRIALDGELPAQHPRRPAVGRPAARLRLPARGRACSCGARAATRQVPGKPRGRRGRERRRTDRRRDAPDPAPVNASRRRAPVTGGARHDSGTLGPTMTVAPVTSVGFLAPMPSELRPLVRRLHLGRGAKGDGAWHTGRLGAATVVATTTGIGTASAAARPSVCSRSAAWTTSW